MFVFNTNKIKLKAFHCEILNNHAQLSAEADLYKSLPVVTEVGSQMVSENFTNIKKEVSELIENEIDRILNTPGLDRLSK